MDVAINFATTEYELALTVRQLHVSNKQQEGAMHE
jgi:hypothetical protein